MIVIELHSQTFCQVLEPKQLIEQSTHSNLMWQSLKQGPSGIPNKMKLNAGLQRQAYRANKVLGRPVRQIFSINFKISLALWILRAFSTLYDHNIPGTVQKCQSYRDSVYRERQYYDHIITLGTTKYSQLSPNVQLKLSTYPLAENELGNVMRWESMPKTVLKWPYDEGTENDSQHSGEWTTFHIMVGNS